MPAELTAQQAADRRPRERGRVAAVEATVEHVGRHDAVDDALGHQRSVRRQLDGGLGRVRHVHEPEMRIGEAAAVAGEVLERGQHAGRVQAGQVRARVGDDGGGLGAERAAVAHDDRVGGVVADVHHRGQVPVDAGLAQAAADAPRLQLGGREVAALAEVPVRERVGVARARPQPHDAPALGIHRDEESPPGAGLGARVHPGGEGGHLRGRAHVATEEQRAARARLAQQALQLGVALAGRAVKTDQQQVAEPRDQRGDARGIGRRQGAAGGGGDDETDEEGAAEPANCRRPRRAAARARDRPAPRRRRRA